VKKTTAGSGALPRFVAQEKPGLHPRNRHRGLYDFPQLIVVCPALARFVKPNAHGDLSIDFANAQAVRVLNRALLQDCYGVAGWDIPPAYLCPPIPGRADYLHVIADLLARDNGGVIARGAAVRGLDVGVGANGVYPLIGHSEYGWSFVGSDIDQVALASLQRVVDANAGLGEFIALRLQSSAAKIFSGVLQGNEVFDFTLCNPPFHASLDEAQEGSARKWRNLGKTPAGKSAKSVNLHDAPRLNFGGQEAELWCPGGELAFVRRMIAESALFPARCRWFTTLVSKAASLPAVYGALRQAGVREWQTLDMAQGQKKSRVVAWTFLDAALRKVQGRKTPAVRRSAGA
jgi:23S rRNA (adenine1618-N6)-methyltransferase